MMSLLRFQAKSRLIQSIQTQTCRSISSSRPRRFPESSTASSKTSNAAKDETSAPAAAVPNSPSPFQLTPDLLKQQKVNKEVTRVPLSKSMSLNSILYLFFFCLLIHTLSMLIYFCHIGGYEAPTLLKAFGREVDTKLPDVESMTWEELFRLNNQKLDKMGMGVQDRRYLLWCLEKFRQGGDPKEYASEERPKKTERGWGPPVKKKKPTS